MSVEALSNSKSTSLLQKHPTITLDTRGMVCPYPMIETRKLSERLGQSDVAEVLTDIEATAKTSIPLVCESLGLDYIVVKEDIFWRIKIARKT
jgi:TusA-related sulfurtransferase